MKRNDDASPLGVWEQNHREATKALVDFAKAGEVDWEQVLTDQQALLDNLLSAEDRRLSRRPKVR